MSNQKKGEQLVCFRRGQEDRITLSVLAYLFSGSIDKFTILPTFEKNFRTISSVMPRPDMYTVCPLFGGSSSLLRTLLLKVSLSLSHESLSLSSLSNPIWRNIQVNATKCFYPMWILLANDWRRHVQLHGLNKTLHIYQANLIGYWYVLTYFL